MRKFSTEWLVSIAAIVLIGFAILVIFFQNEIYWERAAKKEYRNIKASMEVHYWENSDEFPRIWRFSKGLPEGIDIDFLENNEVNIKLYENPVIITEELYRTQIERNRNLDIAEITLPIRIENDSTFSDLDKDSEPHFILTDDSSSSIEEEHFISFYGKMYERGYEDSLAKMNLRPSQIDSLKLLLNQANLYAGFWKDMDGTIYLKYWGLPSVGAFSFVMPKGTFILNHSVHEAGLIDSDINLYWQFVDNGGLITWMHPILIPN